jgi:hypothetical protein
VPVYEKALSALQREIPTKALVLDLRIVAKGCFPHCKSGNFPSAHSAAIHSRLLSRGVIVATCKPKNPKSLSCGLASRDTAVVALTPVRIDSREGKAELTIYYFTETDSGRWYGRGLKVKLERDNNGWRVVSMVPDWFT